MSLILNEYLERESNKKELTEGILNDQYTEEEVLTYIDALKLTEEEVNEIDAIIQERFEGGSIWRKWQDIKGKWAAAKKGLKTGLAKGVGAVGTGLGAVTGVRGVEKEQALKTKIGELQKELKTATGADKNRIQFDLDRFQKQLASIQKGLARPGQIAGKGAEMQQAAEEKYQEEMANINFNKKKYEFLDQLEATIKGQKTAAGGWEAISNAIQTFFDSVGFKKAPASAGFKKKTLEPKQKPTTKVATTTTTQKSKFKPAVEPKTSEGREEFFSRKNLGSSSDFGDLGAMAGS